MTAVTALDLIGTRARSAPAIKPRHPPRGFKLSLKLPFPGYPLLKLQGVHRGRVQPEEARMGCSRGSENGGPDLPQQLEARHDRAQQPIRPPGEKPSAGPMSLASSSGPPSPP